MKRIFENEEEKTIFIQFIGFFRNPARAVLNEDLILAYKPTSELTSTTQSAMPG